MLVWCKETKADCAYCKIVEYDWQQVSVVLGGGGHVASLPLVHQNPREDEIRQALCDDNRTRAYPLERCKLTMLLFRFVSHPYSGCSADLCYWHPLDTLIEIAEVARPRDITKVKFKGRKLEDSSVVS